MRFLCNYRFGKRLLNSNNICVTYPSGITQRTFSSGGKYEDNSLLLFYKNEVQDILKRITGFDLNKVLTNKKLGEKLEPPNYQFMTSQQVKETIEKSKRQAEDLLQMPPIVPIRKEVDVILSKDPELIGLDNSKYLFTDISFGKTDRTRNIFARDPDGTLRKAYWMERRHANQTYFPRPGRQLHIPKMFHPDFLKPILERGDYIFILDRACIEFDPDDPEYHRVTHTTYDHIEEKSAFGKLRFTRHFGPMAFYLVLNKNIDNLLLENLQTNRLEDAVGLVSLYHIVHPNAQSANVSLQPEQEISFIKEFIDKDSKLQVALELALMNLKKTDTLSRAFGTSTN